MGTKTSYKSLGHDPKEDYRGVTRTLEKEGKVIASSAKSLKKLLKDPRNHFIKFGRNDIYAVNRLRYKGNLFLLLEGNPVTYYHSIAYDALPQIEEARILLLDSLQEGAEGKLDTSVAFSYVFKVGSSRSDFFISRIRGIYESMFTRLCKNRI